MESNNNNSGRDLQLYSSNFMEKMQNEFSSLVGEDVEFSSYQKVLARNMFIKITNQLSILEADRAIKNPNKLPYVWKNINLEKLYSESIHRVNLGLDAMLPNMISPIPYWNSKMKCYDLNLQIGYKGQEYLGKRFSIEQPKDIRYELIYDTDEFQVIKKDIENKIESYKLKIKNPFNRGNIIGGVGLIEYDNEEKNKVVIVPESEFIRWDQGTFWKNNPIDMRYKTLVKRTVSKLSLDPKKIENLALSYSSIQDIDKIENAEVVEIQEKDIQGSENIKFKDTDISEKNTVKEKEILETKSESKTKIKREF